MKHRSMGRTAMRLTKRGKVVFGAMFFVAALGLVLAIIVGVLNLGVNTASANAGGSATSSISAGGSGADASATSLEASVNEFGYVILQPGDSVWSVATSLAANEDPRDLVLEIIRLNSLEGALVNAGDALAVPLRFVGAPGVIAAETLGL